MSDLPELSEDELSSPHFTLAAKTVNADELEPRMNARKPVSKFERVCFRINRPNEKSVLKRNQHGQPKLITYSLISFSLSKGLLGFLDVLLSEVGGRKACEFG